ncbi:MAG: putative T7SS-secreted protein, partial [Acidimicrobiia bacterium]
NKIRGLEEAGHQLRNMEPSLLSRSPLPGSRSVDAPQGFGNKMKLAWDSFALDTAGASMKEKGLSMVVDKVAPQSFKDSLGSAIRADSTLDPTSWWSRGPQIAQQAPGVGLGVYNMFTGSEAPAAGTP